MSGGHTQRPKLASELKEALTQFSESTSAHGPPKIVGHKYIIAKIFWVVLFLTGICVFGYFSHKLVTSYLKFESTTDIELKFDILDFPAVSICNLNQFRKDRLPADIKEQINIYTEAKRHDLFGGQDEFEQYFASHPTESKLDIPDWESTAATAPPVPPSTSTTTSPPAGKRRKKRASSKLSEERLDIINDMLDFGFYRKPNTSDVASMAWFSNVGQTSADKSILLNLTRHISLNSTDDKLRAYGHDIQEMLQECVFQGRTCGPEDFYQFYDRRYGNCYTFNSGMDGETVRITSPGSAFGLNLIFFINQPMYIPVLTPQAGLRLLLHRQGEVPLISENGFNAPPGTKSAIAVKYVEVERLTKPQYSGCTTTMKRPAQGGLHEYYPGNYTQQACLKTCLQKGIIKACGCANALYRGPDNEETCGPWEYDCVDDTEERLLNSNECLTTCPLPCWESAYQHTISTSQWPSNNYEPYLEQTLESRGKALKRILDDTGRDGIAEEFVKLEIYFDNLNYYKYKERASMSFEDLVGALGGHLGLWIGMSVISFVEVFELIVTLFSVCAKYLCRNESINKVKEDAYH